MMRTFLLSLLVFGMIFSLVSAFPEGKRSEHYYNGFAESVNNKANERSFQRRKPPAKVPGPQLTKEPESLGGYSDDQGRKQLLIDQKNKKNADLVQLDNTSKFEPKNENRKDDEGNEGNQERNTDMETKKRQTS